jgi:hypothetical protein
MNEKTGERSPPAPYPHVRKEVFSTRFFVFLLNFVPVDDILSRGVN